jgi:plasmid rolling circle replication initiator protein Rep
MKNKKKDQTSQQENFQIPLNDFKSNGKKRPWNKYKAYSDAVGQACLSTPGMEHLGEKIMGCGSFLGMFECEHVKHGKKLKKANFCKLRPCVGCQWRKALKVRHQTHEYVLEHLKKYGSDIPILVTLTVPNVKGEDIGKTVDKALKAWNKLTKFKKVRLAIRSWFRSVETTNNENRGDYHPHIHAILMVPAEYFRRKNGLYITHDELLQMWRQCMEDDSITQVDIRPLISRENWAIESLIAEVAKYAVKPDTYIRNDENGKKKADRKVVEDTYHGLKGRRLIAFGGYFREIEKQKKKEAKEKASLLSAEEKSVEKTPTCETCNKPLFYAVYSWYHEDERYWGRRKDDNYEKNWENFKENCSSVSKAEAELAFAYGFERKEEQEQVQELVQEKENKANPQKNGSNSYLLMILKQQSQKRKKEFKDPGLSQTESSLIQLRGPP